MNDHELKQLLNYDPLDTAEKITGESYKESKETSALGFLLAMDNNKRKLDVLKNRNDTYHGMNFVEYIEIAKSEGFIVVYTKNRQESRYDGSPVEETHMLLWHDQMGFLLSVDSYMGQSVNSACMYYNINFGETIPHDYFKYTSSGHFILSEEKDEDGYKKAKPVWVGDHDAREALRMKMSDFRKVTTMPVWEERPFLWLLNYSQKTERVSYKEINAQVIAELPQYVQDAIAGKDATVV